jgi:hypothetical protein
VRAERSRKNMAEVAELLSRIERLEDRLRTFENAHASLEGRLGAQPSLADLEKTYVSKLAELRCAFTAESKEHFAGLKSLYQTFTVPLAGLVTLVVVVVAIFGRVDLQHAQSDFGGRVEKLEKVQSDALANHARDMDRKMAEHLATSSEAVLKDAVRSFVETESKPNGKLLALLNTSIDGFVGAKMDELVKKRAADETKRRAGTFEKALKDGEERLADKLVRLNGAVDVAIKSLSERGEAENVKLANLVQVSSQEIRTRVQALEGWRDATAPKVDDIDVRRRSFLEWKQYVSDTLKLGNGAVADVQARLTAVEGWQKPFETRLATVEQRPLFPIEWRVSVEDRLKRIEQPTKIAGATPN